MPQPKKQLKAKESILQTIVKYNKPSFPIRIIQQELGIDYLTGHGVIHQLIAENLIEYVNGQKDLIILTEDGLNAARIGYELYIRYADEVEQTRKQYENEKSDLEHKKLKFEFKTRWLVYASFVLSILSLIVSIISWYYPRN